MHTMSPSFFLALANRKWVHKTQELGAGWDMAMKMRGCRACEWGDSVSTAGGRMGTEARSGWHHGLC